MIFMNYESLFDKKQTPRGAKNNLSKHNNKGDGNTQKVKHLELKCD